MPHVMDTPRQGFPNVIHPGCVFEGTMYKNLLSEYFEPFVMSKLRDMESVMFHRSFALGDVIQLIPVIRKVQKYYNIKNIAICTYPDIILLQTVFPEIKFMTEPTFNSLRHKYKLSLNLDSVLERDHSLSNAENSKHRIEIYFKYFDIPLPDKNELDWEGDLEGVVFPMLDKSKKYIGLQIKGSCDIKTLPYDYIKQLAETLSKEYTVILLDQNKSVGFEGPNILNLCGQLTVRQCIALLNNIQVCITMDSGMLWMAHIASCPIVTILGPTREEERVSLHPLYPEKAKCISISKELIGCKPCFETKSFCGGRIRCMKDFPRDKLTSLIQEKIKQILGVV
jgi:ADP-heptose:LPS heptosyltransferase